MNPDVINILGIDRNPKLVGLYSYVENPLQPESSRWFASGRLTQLGGYAHRYNRDTLGFEFNYTTDTDDQNSHYGVGVHPNREIVAFGRANSNGKSLAIYPMDGGDPLFVVTGLAFRQLAFSSNHIFASRNTNPGTIRVYDLDTFALQNTINTGFQANLINSVDVSRAGFLYYAVWRGISNSHMIQCYNLNTHALISQADYPSSPDGIRGYATALPGGDFIHAYSNGLLQRRTPNQSLVWSRQHANFYLISKHVVDYDGNIYACGHDSNSDSVGLNKFDPEGNLLWRDNSIGRASGVTVDTENRVVVRSTEDSHYYLYEGDGNQLLKSPVGTLNRTVNELHPGRYGMFGI